LIRNGPDLNDAVSFDGDVRSYGQATPAVKHQTSANDKVRH
jgi:hypothetical protein